MNATFTTPAKFLYITQTAKATRIHRITCRRKGEGMVLDQAVPNVIAGATPATCCRPKAAEEHIEAAKEILLAQLEGSQPELAELAPKPKAKKASKPKPFSGAALLENIVEQAAAEEFVASSPITAALAEATDEALYGKTIFMTDAKVSKHYWNAFGRDGGTAVAQALGVGVYATAKDFSLLLTSMDEDLAARAATAVTTMWVEGFAAFKLWRKADETYKALPSQDTHWATSERYAMEQDWLSDWANATALKIDGVL